MIFPILKVADVDKSIAFYEKLGFTKQMAMPGPDGKNSFGTVGLGSDSIGLDLGHAEHQGSGVDLMVSVAQGASVDAIHDDVKAKGIAIVDELKTQYWGDRTFSVFDPDGYRITLFQTVEQMDMEKVAAVLSGKEPAV